MKLPLNNRAWPIAGMLCLLLAGLACSLLPAGQASRESSRLAATRTPMPTFTPTVPAQVSLSVLPTPTETPPPPPPPTDTPLPPPPTETPVPEPTATEPPPPPSPTEPPPPPAQQEAAAPAEAPPPPAEPGPSAHGVTGKISFRDGRDTYAVGEKVFVRIEVVNSGDGRLPFGILGLTPDQGGFQTSWSNDAFDAGKPFTHEDGLAFSMPGNHKLWLSICFSPIDVCQGADGDWERFEPGLDVIVQ